jgi:hypothetical protein
MKIVWDLDGTLLKDIGKNYDDPSQETPLSVLFRSMVNIIDYINIVVTGRTELPKQLEGLFDEVNCRDWEPQDWTKYYPQYFQWKVDTILKLKPDLVFDDDQQICRYLIKKGLNVVWVPEYAFMHEV